MHLPLNPPKLYVCKVKPLKLFLAVFAFHSSHYLNAQIIDSSFASLLTEPKHYICYKTNSEITCDGKMDEKDWASASWTDLFTDIEGKLKPSPYFTTKVKMLFDDKNLYIAAELTEDNIWAYLTMHDDTIYHDNDFEVFLDPEGSTHNYFEIEVNALKTVFDLYMNKPYRNAGSALINWDVKDFKLGIYIDGTLNNSADKDNKWVVEMAIPFSSLSKGETRLAPIDNELWRVNFSRVEWDTKFIDGKYQRQRNPKTEGLLPEHNWVWSPQGIINMHYPERWGYVQFSNKLVGHDTISFELPYPERIKRYLWLFYYKEKEYADKHHIYCSHIQTLGYKNDKITSQKNKQSFTDALDNTVTLQATDHQFEIIVENKIYHEKWMINQDGEIINRTIYEQKGFH